MCFARIIGVTAATRAYLMPAPIECDYHDVVVFGPTTGAWRTRRWRIWHDADAQQRYADMARRMGDGEVARMTAGSAPRVTETTNATMDDACSQIAASSADGAVPGPSGVVIVGDAFDLIGDLADLSVDLILTSPPFWGLRSYGLEHNEHVLDHWRAAGHERSQPPGYCWYRDAGGVLGAPPQESGCCRRGRPPRGRQPGLKTDVSAPLATSLLYGTYIPE